MSSATSPASPPTVIVVGSVNMDLVFTGMPALPAPGETIAAQGLATHLGGKGGNQAAAAARLGADVWLVANVGADGFGEQAVEDLVARGVHVDAVGRSAEATGVAAVLIDLRGENSIVISPGANATLGDVPAAIVAASLPVDHAYVLASLEVPLATVVEWARVAADRGWKFILNPAPYPPAGLPDELLQLAHIVVPNEVEHLSIMDALTSGANAPTMVVTLGANGSRVLPARGDGEPTEVAPFRVEAVDSTGAGDAFNAALTVALARGEGLAQAVVYANAAGALATTAVGARSALPSAAEVSRLVAGRGRNSEP